MTQLNVGDPAPDFRLPTDDGSELSLADLAGRWAIIYFYPKDNTSGCTAESCDFRDQYEHFADGDCAIVGVSADSVASHARFKAKHELPFRLVSDADKEMLTAYGVWAEKKNYGRTYMGIVRSTYIIGPDGRVAAAYTKVRVRGHVQAVLDELNKLQERP